MLVTEVFTVGEDFRDIAQERGSYLMKWLMSSKLEWEVVSTNKEVPKPFFCILVV